MRSRMFLLMVLSCALAVVGMPRWLPAQATRGAAADTPSRNRETRLQHDSLAVHFVRQPKAKPSGRARSAGPVAPAQSSVPRAPSQDTPLPEKRRGTGKP